MKTKVNIISKELAKRLLDKGFDYDVEYFYNEDGSMVKEANYTNKYNGRIPAPSSEIVLQFFREELDIDIFLARIGNITMPNIGYSFIVFFQDDNEPKYINKPFHTAEDAIVYGILTTLDYLDGQNNFANN